MTLEINIQMVRNGLVYLATFVLWAVFVFSIFVYQSTNNTLVAVGGTISFGLGLLGLGVSLGLCIDRNRPSLDSIDE